ncbi:P-loop containing nucleoside triphosphate hydrolase protein [Pyronema domesticum]|nr:P-loop containing nucleoside triphosphate hydrolase protein [Pyronema domesticum]
MARYDSRSRSPARANGYSKRRDDRYDPRGARPRSRSRDRRDYRDRERERDRERDRDRGGRRERSADRRRRDDFYDPRDDRRRDERDRPREKERSRERRGGERRRSRSKDGDRTRRDRERDRDERERPADARRDEPRRGDRDRRDSPAAAAPQTEDEKIRQRRERLEAWKKKKAEEEAAKASASPAAMLTELERQRTASAATTAPKSAQEPPKVSAQQATASASLPNSNTPRTKADPGSSVPPSVPLVHTTANGSALPTNRPVSTFGFGAAKKNADKGKRTLDFGDEESSRKKLERLPSPIPGDADTNGAIQEDIDDDTEMQDATEEESAAAARAAAEQRRERAEAAALEAATAMEVDNEELAAAAPVEEEEEADPLDAFMAGITNSVAKEPRVTQSAPQDRQVFGDDEAELVAHEDDPDDILAMAAKLKKKKELPTINHAKVDYEPFRKNFYVEPTELANLSEAEVDHLRLELDGIKVRGQDVPKPVMKWSQCGLPSQSLKVIQDLGYDRPTSIQAQAIPAVMSGRNVIGVAKTGSGKTIAFLLPMFRHIKDQRALDPQDGPISLIMTPTRELAVQIYEECKPFLKALNLRAVCAYGGSPIKDQIADLKRGAEIIVCTPGRMVFLLAANGGRVTNLKRTTYVVLDEADRMFDMGLEPQVMKIIANVRPDRQTVLFSATFPRQMEALARKILVRPVEIVVGARSVVAPEIEQIVEVRAEADKFIRVLELLGNLHEKDEDARSLIFVNRQEAADGLLRDLMRRGYPCMSIHGAKDQIDRDSTISDFKAGIVPVLIATSVAARGLDVKQLKLVINYDCPNHMEDYVHRVGRTGRAGNTGTAVTFITEDQDRYSVDIAKALRLSKQPIPPEVQKLVDGFNEKVKAGKEKPSGSGFGGKGLERLDQERDLARRRERKQFGGEDGVEEVDDEEEAIFKPASAPKAAGSTDEPAAGDDDVIVVHKRGTENALDRVKQAASAVDSRLKKNGELRTGVPIDNKGPDAGAYHATLEINDFPQKARWAVTNRTNIAKVLEQTGTSITTKGSYYPAGKSPTAGQDPKLYILVEGDTELVVTNAMRELKRLLAEGTAAAVDESRAPTTGGRYTV